MPGTVAETPSISLSFANNFWGKDDAGVGPMFERMHNAKVTCDELRYFYSTRAAIEDEYARKLLALCRKPLGSSEMGTLRASLDTVRGETEAIGKTHSAIASQMKSELEEPLAAFAGGMKERRKIVQNGIEKLLKSKMQQTNTVNKSRDRYEQDCLRIKGYLAQGHMVMGQEERKNKAKLEKTQIQLASNSSEYEAAIKILEETTGRWNKEWKAACDKFQDLEEERLDFTKSSLWTYANIASTACVSDDQAFEKIRVSLESCEVEKDISFFINERGTGQEIPDAPKFINFCRGDLNDTSSETSEEDNYSVAQFQRTINPAYRSSSPQPSTYESHHDPDSELAMRMSKNDPGTPSSREATITPQKAAAASQAMKTSDGRQRRHAPSTYVSSQRGEPSPITHNEYPPDGSTPQSNGTPDSRRGRHVQQEHHQHVESPIASRSEYPVDGMAQAGSRPDSRRAQQVPPNYDPSQHGEIPTVVPHNEYPTDGMTMFCRTGPPSEKSSGASIYRPSSRDSRSEISNPTSFSSEEPPSQQPLTKPVNQALQAVTPTNKQQSPQKKRSTFFSNSPFRRKSKHEKERQQSTTANTNRNTWAAPKQISPSKPVPFQPRNSFNAERTVASPEPADPRASFQLNVGNNVFDVASPDKTNTKEAKRSGENREDVDPIAQALANLKGVGKQSSVRVSADRYHGVTSPVPPPAPSDGNVASAQRGTPPPAYNDSPARRLDAPQPAFTSAQMQKTTRKYVGRTQEMFNRPSQSVQRPSMAASQTAPRPSTATTQAAPRATSPAPSRRSVSPRPSSSSQTQYARPSSSNNTQTQYTPSASQNSSMNSRYRQSPSVAPAKPVMREPSYSPQYSRHNSPIEPQRTAVSPRPHFVRPERPGSSNGMELQLSTSQVDPYYGQPAGSVYGGSQRGHGQYNERPLSMYYGSQDTGAGDQAYRSRSRSVAAYDARQYSRDGRPVLHFSRAMYSYTAAIPEELGFTKGDILAVLRHQDDGWWEAEVMGQSTPPGLVPSNYLSQC